MKVLVTGGAGFIGSHLAEALVKRDDSVVALDDLSTGRRENVAALETGGRFRFVEGSCLDPRNVDRLVEESDLVVHLAAAVGVRLIVERPVHTIETNVRATEIVLEAAARRSKPVVLASTSEVYGKSAKVPFVEEDDISLGPTSRSRWAYACSKALDEWLALAYVAERNAEVVIVRFFNTVGPRQTGQYGMVLPNFARQALLDQPITVYGDGTQSRCFGHVKDAVEALLRLSSTPSARGRVFNVGNDEEITMLELAKRVRDAAGSRSEIVLVPYEKAYSAGFEDMPRRVPDLTRLESTCGFRPRTPLSSIIEDVLTDQRARLAVGAAHE
jgi:UDP-glucose 4-epimerase